MGLNCAHATCLRTFPYPRLRAATPNTDRAAYGRILGPATAAEGYAPGPWAPRGEMVPRAGAAVRASGLISDTAKFIHIYSTHHLHPSAAPTRCAKQLPQAAAPISGTHQLHPAAASIGPTHQLHLSPAHIACTEQHDPARHHLHPSAAPTRCAKQLPP